MGGTGNKVSKYFRIALRLTAVAAVLAVIYFVIEIYSFITLRLESSVYHYLAYELVQKLAEMDLPDGEIKDIPVFKKFEHLPAERIVKNGKYVDRWGNPLDIRIVKEDGRCTVTIISHGRGRWFFSRDDIEVTQIIGLPRPSDDVAEVKRVLVKDLELTAEGKFREIPALRTPDFVEESHGSTSTLEQMEWLTTALDGKHPEEFALLMVTGQNNGRSLSAAEIAEIRREAARDQEFIKQYKAQVANMASMLKTNAAFQLKAAMKIIDIKVDGDSAVAVVEYDTKLPGTSKCRARFAFRKVNGEWKICRTAVEAAE